jgi:catechol 2,3-dioxygenase-like lactoylglutathione lyase family enzyme
MGAWLAMEWNTLVPELVVADYERSKAFYVEVFGFSVRFERPASRLEGCTTRTAISAGAVRLEYQNAGAVFLALAGSASSAATSRLSSLMRNPVPGSTPAGVSMLPGMDGGIFHVPVMAPTAFGAHGLV